MNEKQILVVCVAHTRLRRVNGHKISKLEFDDFGKIKVAR